jgi:thioesterase domain-containing protein
MSDAGAQVTGALRVGRFEQLAEHHVRTIRLAQPEGPYLIAGECTGGALAYEIARQLRADGEQVALLALIDAFPAGAPPLARFMPRPAHRVLHRARILGFHCANLLRLPVRAKLEYAASKAARALRALARRAAAMLRRATPTGAAPAEAPAASFGEALAAYHPQPHTGSAVVFRAARLPLGVRTTPDLGWGALVSEIEVEEVPGYFTTPISEPGVRTLAARLSRHLRTQPVSIP